MKTHFQRIAAVALAAAALSAGCVTVIPEGKPAYVYVAGNGTVTFKGDTFASEELPERLLKAGAVPNTRIFLIAQGDVPSELLGEMAMACGRVGLPKCTIRDRVRISVEKAGDRK